MLHEINECYIHTYMVVVVCNKKHEANEAKATATAKVKNFIQFSSASPRATWWCIQNKKKKFKKKKHAESAAAG